MSTAIINPRPDGAPGENSFAALREGFQAHALAEEKSAMEVLKSLFAMNDAEFLSMVEASRIHHPLWWELTEWNEIVKRELAIRTFRRLVV